MSTLLFSVPIRSKKDLLCARQRARQLAHWFRFGPHDEALIVAGTFAVGLKAREVGPRFEICFSVEHHQLVVHVRWQDSPNLPKNHVAEGDRVLLKLTKMLPQASLIPSPEEVSWVLGQVDRQAHPDLFAEVSRQNQEILILLHELQLVPEFGGKRDQGRTNPTAA